MAETTNFHRKIELQSPDDLMYLVDNIRRAAAVEIEKALPQIHGADEAEKKEDDMRVVVEKLVNNYIQQTLSSLLPNITINGLPPSPSLILPPSSSSTSSQPQTVKEQYDYEPFNSKTFSKATDLMAKEASLIEEIAKLRRTRPQELISREQQILEKAEVEEEDWMKALEEKWEREDREGRKGVVLEAGRLEGNRLRSTKEGYGSGVAGLERVVEKGPGLVARVEKAMRAEEYVVTGK